jgi:predicted dehydrogenase
MTVPNIAVLGLSHGWKFVERLMKVDFANLIAVADLNVEKALGSYSVNEEETKNRLKSNLKTYQNYKDLLSDLGDNLDGVVAALPNDIHLEVTEEAAKRGINLLLEKPIASHISDAEKITEIVDKSEIGFMVGHHRRFSKKINRVKEIIAEGELGEIIGANIFYAVKKPDDYFTNSWRIDKEVGGPLLINIIHDVDDLRYIIAEIDVVQAMTTNRFRGNQVEDTAVINLGLKNGALATIFLTDNSPSPWYYEGCTQEYSFFYPSNYDCYYFFGKKASLTFPTLEKFSYDPELGVGWHRPFKRESIPVTRFDVIEEELKHFCKIINGEEKSRVTAADATNSLRVVEAIKKSSETGKTISIL